MTDNATDDALAQISRILAETDSDTQKLVARVLQVEKKWRHVGSPTSVDHELVDVVKELIK